MDEQPEPDTKDWTWVLERPCPECGFDSREPARADLAPLSQEIGRRWVAAMSDQVAAAERPSPRVWSPLEYACHVRDVFALACIRTDLMLEQDDPAYPNWDQDETAITDHYAAQDPDVATAQLAEEAERFAAVLARVPDDAWERTGRRGDGARFTVESFARYLVHDPIHHLTDVTGERWA